MNMVGNDRPLASSVKLSLAALAGRLTIGWMFASSGWGKLNNLDGIVAYFTKLGIPWPALMAPAVSAVEAAAGLMLLIGALARLAALPLMAIMLVALATARRDDIESWSDVLGLSEFLILIILLQVCLTGAGRWSVDQQRRARRGRRTFIPPA